LEWVCLGSGQDSLPAGLAWWCATILRLRRVVLRLPDFASLPLALQNNGQLTGNAYVQSTCSVVRRDGQLGSRDASFALKYITNAGSAVPVSYQNAADWQLKTLLAD
jgi:hypothetical protein